MDHTVFLSRAARSMHESAIRRAGDYRWVGIYEVMEGEIANVAFDKFRSRIKMFWLAVFMNLRYQRIKYPDAMSALNQRVDKMRPDKTCTTRN